MLRRLILGSAAVWYVAAAALGADETVFLPGSSAGLVPPRGLTHMPACTCFMNADNSASIVMTEAPPEAYAQFDTQLVGVLQRQGMATPTREDWPVGTRKGFMVSGEQKYPVATGHRRGLIVDAGAKTLSIDSFVRSDRADAYPAAVMIGALRSLQIRDAVTLAEQIGALPFRIGDFGGFRPVSTLAGAALMLTEGPADVVKTAEQPVVWATVGLGGDDTPVGRARSASDAMKGSTVKNERVVESEDYRVKDVNWYRIETAGNDRTSGEPVRRFAILRFHAGGALIVNATIREADRARLAPRVRRLAESIALR